MWEIKDRELKMLGEICTGVRDTTYTSLVNGSMCLNMLLESVRYIYSILQMWNIMTLHADIEYYALYSPKVEFRFVATYINIIGAVVLQVIICYMAT